MTVLSMPPPTIIIIGGPNGAGKTTVSREVLAETLGITKFVNADIIAAGLSGFDPERGAFAVVSHPCWNSPMPTTRKTPGQLMREVRPIADAVRRAIARATARPKPRPAPPASPPKAAPKRKATSRRRA